MTNKQIRQLIASPTQVLVTDGVDPESNLGYYGLSSIGKDLLGVTTASQGQEALALVPGTHVQAYDSDLDAIAALTTTGLIDRTGAGTATTRTTGTTGLNVLAAADEATARSAIGAMANTAPEIITNANGTAYRWPNGLQICATTINLNYVDTGLLAATWTYPAAFTTGSVPHCFLSPPVTGQGGSINGPLWNTTDYRKVAVFGANQPNNPHLSAILRIWSIAGQTFSTEYISCQAVAIGTYTP